MNSHDVFVWLGTTLATLVDSVHFKLVNGRCTSFSVTDKNLANVGLDVVTNQGDCFILKILVCTIMSGFRKSGHHLIGTEILLLLLFLFYYYKPAVT